MKTKNLFLCLLFLVLGTTAAWADKYYQPGSYRTKVNQRLTLERALNSKFLIYNTAISGNQDRTGFLRNDGVKFEHDKTKERDLFVYNETFVYTMEAYDDDADGVNDWYAIKSVNTGLYVNAEGRTDIGSAQDAKLYITDWDHATNKAGVNMESWEYNIIGNANITGGGHGSTVFVVKSEDGKTCWNGNTDSFATWSDGHPYAFYVANEFTGGEHLTSEYMQDLHIYSRCDIYSAQVIYGLVQNPSQITTNHKIADDNTFGHLFDGDGTSFNVTDWNANTEGDYHYYQINLGKSVNALHLYMQRRADGYTAPTIYELQACATENGAYTTIGEFETGLEDNAFYISPAIALGGDYQYIRIVAKETTTTDENYMCVGLAELYVFPTTNEVEDALIYINKSAAKDCPIFTRATEKVYRQKVEEYNNDCPEAKVLSGVPLPGNKYRIYADAYDVTNHVYVNREIKANADGVNLDRVAFGSYHAATDAVKKEYEWYCERTSEGLLVFRNVADPTKFLGNGGMADEPYKWSVSTLGTQRYGVPLMNFAQQYLAVYNDGTAWMGNVKAVQNQTVAPAYIDHDNNNETEAQVVANGLCTDFVFIPVPLVNNEKKITIRANELVERNTRLLFDTNGDDTKEVYSLPFSHMFASATDFSKLELQLLCNELHTYVNVTGASNGNVATRNENVVTFDFTKVENGDVLQIELEIVPPFEVMSSTLDVKTKPSLYLIRNKHQLGLPQQARPQRASDIEIDGGDEPISSQTGKRYYAKFNQRNADMDLVEGYNDWTKTEFHATSLFYFTETEETEHSEYYSVNIQNVTTVMKCADHAAWNTNGNTWFVQPKKISNNYGYNIGRTALNATNNPEHVWGCSHEDGDKITTTKVDASGNRQSVRANDDGTAWEFVKVDDDKAQKILLNFIIEVAGELYAALNKKALEEGIDANKVKYYRYIVDTMVERADGYYKGTFSTPGDDVTAKLLQFAQNIHMLEHEIEYALYELPELSDDVIGVLSQLDNSQQPHWYYIRNVSGTVDGNESYAGFNGNESPMALQQYAAGADKRLANMFYVVGEKNSYAPVVDADPDNNGLYKDFPGNNLIVDEYLKVHIHNFSAKEVTLVSKNVKLNELSSYTPENEGEQKVMTNLDLKSDEDWSIELEYDLDRNASFNAYGSCLLASTDSPLGDSYPNAFQVYLKDDRSIVIKVNNSDDRYRFWHTQDYYSHIKVVITYSQKNVTLDVYNSNGEKETMTITGVTMNPITQLTAALPKEGATITNLSTYQVEAMTWKSHEEVAGDANKDEWYILPSSNADSKGLAIVLGEPNDAKMGWTNDQGGNTFVATDLGTADNSTWKFERVTDFDAHINELLKMYNFEECVIYDRELAKLMGLIERNKALIEANENGDGEEALFNEVYYAFLNYTGCMPEELKAPKAGSLYTIRPVRDEERDSALVVYLDKTINGGCVTKEVYNADAIRKDNSYDSRAAWMFEGTPKGDYLELNGLNVKNIHTQCYLTALGENSSVVNEKGAAKITLAPLGACTTMFQVGGNYMGIGNEVADAEVPVVSYSMNSSAFGSAIAEEKVPSAVKAVINEKNIPHVVGVFYKDIELNLAENGKITAVFKHTSGQHKLNILGVALIDASGNVVQGDYHWGKAGGEHVDNVYELHKTAAHGNYKLRCYVFSGSNDNDDVNKAAGTITVKTEKFARVNYKGTADTKWIVEEIKNPETSVYYETEITDGYSTLMLGFNSAIPAGVEAYYGRADGPILEDRYLSMTSYEGGVLPAMSPVVLKNAAAEETVNAKFYYTATAPEKKADNYMRGSLYFEAVETVAIEEEDYNGNNVNIYMLLTTSTGPTMVWVWEEFDEKGDLYNGGSNDDGGHVICKANKAYIVLRGDEAANATSLLFNFRPGTTGIVPVGLRGAQTSTIEAIYDLQGRKLSEITQPGIYIVNGKKVMVK